MYCRISLAFGFFFKMEIRRWNSNRINHMAFLSNYRLLRFSHFSECSLRGNRVETRKTSQDVNFAITSENGNQLTATAQAKFILRRLHISLHYVICNWFWSERRKSATRHNDNDLERFLTAVFFVVLPLRCHTWTAHKSNRSPCKCIKVQQ